MKAEKDKVRLWPVSHLTGDEKLSFFKRESSQVVLELVIK